MRGVLLKRARLLTAVAVLGGAVTVPVLANAGTSLPKVGYLAEADRCDPLDTADCLLPFPSDFYTVADPRTDTGRRINLSLLSMPANTAGKHVDPSEWNRNDGFSPGMPILVHVPGIDLAKSKIATVDRMADSLKPDAPIVLLDATTNTRWPYWAELDAHTNDTPLDVRGMTDILADAAGQDNPLDALPIPAIPRVDGGDELAQQPLIIRPAKNFPEGHRIVVSIRNVKDSAGKAIAQTGAYVSYRDKLPLTGLLADRVPAMERIFGDLAKAGVGRAGSYLSWDFTIASARNIAGRMLSIRDDAFKLLGNSAPGFVVTNQINFSKQQNDKIVREVRGHFTIPNYLTMAGEPTTRFNYAGSLDGNPTNNAGEATMQADFTCRIPRSVADDGHSGNPKNTHPAIGSLYGHGLLGGQGEVGAGNVSAMANEQHIIMCATDWIGMSTTDLPNIATILADVSNFPTLADRAQQGILNFLYLARLIIHKDGFNTDPAFQIGGKPVFDRKEVVYDGNSQGGIMGGALLAVSQDIKKGVLGVPGINYSTLLNRSVDFDQYAAILYNVYPNRLAQQELFGLMQMLWDRAEGNGYVEHLTDKPYENTPKHQVLYMPAFGDHQVSTLTAEVAARTANVPAHKPAWKPGRLWEQEPLWGIASMPKTPYRGSGFFIWDSGSPAMPLGNIPPNTGQDPHSHPRNTELNRTIKGHFLKEGLVYDLCGSGPCIGTK